MSRLCCVCGSLQGRRARILQDAAFSNIKGTYNCSKLDYLGFSPRLTFVTTGEQGHLWAGSAQPGTKDKRGEQIFPATWKKCNHHVIKMYILLGSMDSIRCKAIDMGPGQ